MYNGVQAHTQNNSGIYCKLLREILCLSQIILLMLPSPSPASQEILLQVNTLFLLCSSLTFLDTLKLWQDTAENSPPLLKFTIFENAQGTALSHCYCESRKKNAGYYSCMNCPDPHCRHSGFLSLSDSFYTNFC